jgi:hypothetical protein
MFGRSLWRVLAGLVFVALLVGAVGLIGWTAYSAGLAQGAAQSGVQPAPNPGSPASGPAYVVPYGFAPFGYGFGSWAASSRYCCSSPSSPCSA